MEPAPALQEETPLPTPTPAPQDKTPKITQEVKTVKVKDPKRVESGKRLALLSKQAREHKKLEEQAQTEVVNGFTPLYVVSSCLYVVLWDIGGIHKIKKKKLKLK